MSDDHKRVGESGRTMRIMLSSPLRQRHGEKGPPVCVTEIPWELFGDHGERASQRNHAQSLDRISERGGFDASEAVCVLTGMTWGQGRSITEEQAHRILYLMRALYRRGALAGRSALIAREEDHGR